MMLSTASAAPSVERRGAPRTRTLKTGLAIYGGYLFVLDCSVRDLSATGAKLAFTPGTPVPDKFILCLPAQESVFEAEVVRRRGPHVAVMFEGRGKTLAEADPRIRRFVFR